MCRAWIEAGERAPRPDWGILDNDFHCEHTSLEEPNEEEPVELDFRFEALELTEHQKTMLQRPEDRIKTIVYPEFVQRFQVQPNEFALEEPYIANNIKMTRLAFGLGGWSETQYDGEAELTPEAIANDAATFADARLWDYRPLQQTLDQLQTVRQYYNFADVDVDRYTINGEQRLVMLSARELNPQRAQQSSTWVNRRIAFTHGIGVAMVPVAGVSSGGLPQLIIRDIPPVSTDGAPQVTEPRIYFGELDDDWVVVGAKTPEFDYPIGEGSDDGSTSADATTSWSGDSGISLKTFADRLLFAARLGDLNLLISDQITAESQLLWRRTVGERISAGARSFVLDIANVTLADSAALESLLWLSEETARHGGALRLVARKLVAQNIHRHLVRAAPFGGKVFEHAQLFQLLELFERRRLHLREAQQKVPPEHVQPDVLPVQILAAWVVARCTHKWNRAAREIEREARAIRDHLDDIRIDHILDALDRLGGFHR